MKYLAIFFLLVGAHSAHQAQDMTGTWYGILKVGGVQLRIVFNVSKQDGTFKTTMDSPDQGAKGIKIQETLVQGDSIHLNLPPHGIAYNGKMLADGSISGIFTQRGNSILLQLLRHEVQKDVQQRPQEPKPPYPYRIEDIEFRNEKDQITLAGTLTTPEGNGPYAAVILISGSGPQDRDETLMGHKPFWVLADYFSRNGIAVLRYDDRGTGKSKGNFSISTTKDFASDAEAAVQYLKARKDLHIQKTGLAGHSEGGIIAPMVAAKNKDVGFIIMLAGTGIRGDKILLEQQQLIGKAMGISDEDLAAASRINEGAYDLVLKAEKDSLANALSNYFNQVVTDHPDIIKGSGMSEGAYVFNLVSQLVNPWMRFFLTYDPAPALEKVTCPILALNGEKDLQVPAAANLEAIRSALNRGKNNDITLIALPGVNHLFQECTTGAPSEYGEIQQTFSPEVLRILTEWINKRVK